LAEPSKTETLSAIKMALAAERRRQQGSQLAGSEPVAIIGMGCRLPGNADTPEVFWRLLCDGAELVGGAPPERWPSLPADVPRYGAFLSGLEWVDAEYFGLSVVEAERMNPAHTLTLETTWEALWDAGIDPDSLAGRKVGVFMGAYESRYGRSSLQVSSAEKYNLASQNPSFAAARVSFLLDLKGPSTVLSTGCSSSLVALHLGMRSLQAGEAEAAIVGGVSLRLVSEEIFGSVLAGLASPDGRTRAFDAEAKGSGPGEGAIVLVLKRLSDAIAGRDRVRAVLRGSAMNHDGRSNTFTAPNGPAQCALIREALSDARVDPGCISLVEAHGSATVLGDAIEAEALIEALEAGGPGAPRCAIGCVKTNIGHLEAASGLAGVLKVVLALENQAIPANLHLKRLNPNIQLDASRFFLPCALTPWPRGPQPRFAGVSSFSLIGSNAHVILEEAPALHNCREPLARRAWTRKRYWNWPEDGVPDFAAADPAVVEAFVERRSREVLNTSGLDRLDSSRSLFEAGLDSLGAVELSRVLGDDCGLDLPGILVFEHPTIAGLGDFLSRNARPPALFLPSSERVPLSPAQQAVWSAQNSAPESTAWQFAFCVRSRPSPDRAAIEDAIAAVAARHEALRSRVVECGQMYAAVNAAGSAPFECVDVVGTTEAELRDRLLRDHRRPFDLTAGPGWRVGLYRRGPEESFLLFSVHEIACDRGSFEILWSEFQECYSARLAGASPRVSSRRTRRAGVASARGGEAAESWSRRLSGAPELDWSAAHPAWVEHRVTLSGRAVVELQRYTGARDATLFMALLAAFRAVLFGWTTQCDMVICSPVAVCGGSRRTASVGAFAAPLPLRLKLSEDAAFTAVLAAAREAVVEAIGWQPFPSSIQNNRWPLFTVFGGGSETLSHPSLGDSTIEPLVLAQEGRCPLELEMTVGAGPVTALWRHDSSWASAQTIASLAAQLAALIEMIPQHANEPLWRILEQAGCRPPDGMLEEIEF
jgi:3-oxoacyl-(acyl-carrier-protein) synthase